MEHVVKYCQEHELRLRLSGIAEDEIVNHDSRVHSTSEDGNTRKAIAELSCNGILKEAFIQHRKILFPGKSWIDRLAIMRSIRVEGH